jgi:hypothetical protein
VSQRRGGQVGAGQLRPAGDCRAKLMPAGALPGSACEVGRDDVSGVPVQAAAAPVIPHRGPRVRMGGCLLDIAERDPGVQTAAVMNACLSVWGVTGLPIPARRAVLRTIRPAACRSSRRSSLVTNTGPSVRSPMTRSIARAVRGARWTVTTLPPLRVMTSVRCPRSSPRCSMSAPVASDTRSPFSASSEISACRLAALVLRRPARRRARCGPARRHGTRSRPAAGGHGPLGSGPGVLLGPRTCRTPRWCTAAG